MRVLVALGGNAMTAPDGRARPEDQRAAVEVASRSLADLVAAGHDLVVTHGNGPQVGNLLVKNELAAHVVPPVPLDWCGAQTQGTIGALLLNALDAELARRAVRRRVAALVTRTLVDRADPRFTRPTKPIGRFLDAAEVTALAGNDHVWHDPAGRGWRRLVPSPYPLEVLDAPAAAALLAAGFVVVCAGGGGIPTVADQAEGTRTLVGVHAVIDKDLTAAVLAAELGVDLLVIATDVDHAILGFGTPQARPLGHVSAAELRGYAADGHFASGSMGPKVEAVLSFVQSSGRRAAITSLSRISEAIAGTAGTIVLPADSAAGDPSVSAGA